MSRRRSRMPPMSKRSASTVSVNGTMLRASASRRSRVERDAFTDRSQKKTVLVMAAPSGAELTVVT